MAKKDDWNITDLEEQDFPAQEGGDYEEDAWDDSGEDGQESGWDESGEDGRDGGWDGAGENGQESGWDESGEDDRESDWAESGEGGRESGWDESGENGQESGWDESGEDGRDVGWDESGEDGRDVGWAESDEDYRETPRSRRGGRRGENGPGKKGRIVGGILVAVGVVCLIAGAGVLVKNHLDTKRVQEQMEVLRNQVELDASRQAADEASRQALNDGQNSSQADGDGQDATQAGQDPSVDQSGSQTGDESGENGQAGEGAQASSEEPVRVPNPYGEYFLENSDMAAWLKIDGTKIDYPVMQTMEDENYYLKRGFDRKSNQNGCLILDTDSTITGELSTNQIIHGHNMKSGEMFGTLTKYEDKKYCEEHKYIKLYTKECERNYEVIAVFRSQVYKKTDDVFKFYKFFQADTQEEFDNWYDNIKALSEFDTGVTAQFGDRFLTLSTCVYHVENGRLVVVAKEIEPGDYYEPVQ